MIDSKPAREVVAAGPRPFAPVWTSRTWLASAALLWVACTAVYFLTAPGRIDMFDGGVRHDVTESLIEIGVPAVRDTWFPGIPGRGGYRYAWYELGSSITAMPFVMLASRLGRGSLEARQFAFAMTSVPFAAGVVVLMFFIFGRLHCSVPSALRWSLVVGFCTMLWPYAGSSFDATLQAFWLTLAIWGAVEAMAGASISWAIASAVAFCMLVNIQESYLVLGASAAAVFPVTWSRVRDRLTDPRFVVVTAGVIIGIALIAAANVLRYGNPLTTGRAITGGPHGVFGNPVIGLAGLLISPAKSVFLYSPVAVVAVVGLYRLLAREAHRLAPVGACVAIHLALIATLRFWHGEWAWGPRYLVATLPLVSIGLPFAFQAGAFRYLNAALCAAGLIVQVLAISVDHQRYYFDRALEPFFWLDEARMYNDSPLFARPRELASVIGGRDLKHVRALVPGPRPLSMTSSIFGPPPSQLAMGHLWVRQYLVFVAPRPWTLWSRYLPPDQRPGNTGRMAWIATVIAIVSAAGLAVFVLPAPRNG